ncbi:oligoendopeptidase F [Ferrimonas lipolytica]|uniref:Oligopeptidase F n=1 Tax=Ferrimonas lipolytica TaxID=2724191 RepID=A0A6H1UHK7_9GAMM|nr:oligoendopeptidase F [Ferrimonas lipolytica]QIZ78595.1 oligoendopeptidase F [Ferrimonas lipolytica]
MKKTLIALSATLAIFGNAQAQVTLPESPNWNLIPIYQNWNAWQQHKAEINNQLGDIKQFQGKLDNSEQLLAAITHYFEMTKQLTRLNNYTSLNADTDLRNSDNTGRRAEIRMIYNQFSQNASFINPELIAIGQAKVDAMIAEQPALAAYRFPLQRILDGAAHTLSAESEQLLASMGTMANGASTTFGTFVNAELPWQTIEVDGKEQPLNPSLYGKLRVSEDRATRQQAFDTFFGSLNNYRRTLASTLNSQVNNDVFYAKARNYPNALAASVADDNIPEDVYRQLVKTTNDNLPTFHRYLKLRQRMLGLEEQSYYDIYAPLGDSSMEFPIDKGVQMMMDSLAPMGEDYTSRIAKGLEDGWMDTYPTTGKRLGAYMSGSTYDVHPYVLMNYNDNYSEVRTLTHEWGHAIHSVYSNEAQPWQTSGYSIYVAEIASTFQEHLLAKYVKETTTDDDARLYYLGQTLEGIRGTFFRQTMFAEFELAIHESVEAGKPLSDTRINEIYLDLLRRYHGHDEGIMKIDEAYAIEWAYVPHFYYNFYVYQYATSIAASAQFAEDVLESKPAYDKYLTMLKSGGNAYPHDIVKTAGVDLASPEPYEALMRKMNDIMDEMEAILKKQGK